MGVYIHNGGDVTLPAPCGARNDECRHGWWGYLNLVGQHAIVTDRETFRDGWLAKEQARRIDTKWRDENAIEHEKHINRKISNHEAQAIARAVFELGLLKPGEIFYATDH